MPTQKPVSSNYHQSRKCRKETYRFIRPFIKWVGGKRSILPELIKRMPKNYNNYHEPFVGGGALFLALKPKNVIVSDINKNLSITYRVVRDNMEGLIKQLIIHRKNHCKDYFLKARKQLSLESDSVKIAGLFIYLNKTCYNGLYRVNKKGGFNVPIGNYVSPKIVDEINLREVSSVLQDITINNQCFENTNINEGDFYYLDPPYHNAYSAYDGSGFTEENHVKLAEFCKRIDESKGLFMLSNSDTAFVRDLYNKYNIDDISASNMVSCNPNRRGKRKELIIRNFG